MADRPPGPLRADAGGRHLVDLQGRPYFWLGDTAWPFFAEYPDEAARAYLADRGGKGFTVIQAVLAWGKGSGYEADRPLANPDGEEPWRDGDPSRPNERYFDRVERLIGLAGESGLVVAALPTWGHYVHERPLLTTANAGAYGRWLGRRFRATPNLVWVNGGDRIPTGREDVWRALGIGLKQGDGGTHPVTCHVPGMYSSSMFWQHEEWLDCHMIQTWGSRTRVHAMVSTDRGLTPARPVIHGEGAYENGPEYPDGPITAWLCRKQAWWAFLAGGFHTYGQNQMWRMEPGWQGTFDTPGARQVGLIRKLLGERRWWELVPDQAMIAAGVGSEETFVACARAADRSWAFVYLPVPVTVRIETTRIAAPRARATWIDPRTGGTTDAGLHPTGNGGGGMFPETTAFAFTPPAGWEDALLLLEAAA